MPLSSLPAIDGQAIPVKQVQQFWAGPDTTVGTNQYDVVVLGADGHVYHAFWRPGIGWAGWESFTRGVTIG